ncbi:hypothetical protein M0802_008799 [Mischocyttarus mexicanus]|nr:hypothetical protein M0802_008799 [Mischocyttarus mexicanus]
MAFKLIALSALLAIAQAGGPAAYDIATASADLSSVGYSQESTQKGYAGQNVVSSYSRAEDSAHSSVRVSNSHVTNDALTYAAAPAAVIAKPAYTAATYAAPVVAKAALAPATYTTYAAHATPVLAKTAYAAAPAYSYAAHAAAPAYSYAAHAVAPAYSYAAHAAPVLAKTAYAAAPAYGYAAHAAPVLASQLHAAAPVYSYAAHSGPVVTKTTYGTSAYGYASPLVAKTAYATAPLVTKATVAAPAVVTKTAYAAPAYAAPAYAAPAYAATTYGYAAHATPVLAKAAYSAPIAHVAATPVIAKTAHVGPAYGYAAEYAAPVVHATFTGLGTSYACKNIKDEWEISKSIRSNLKEMGLVYDPNETLPVPNVKHDLLEEAKQKMIENGMEIDSEDENVDIKKEPAKVHVAKALEDDAKAPRERMFRLPNGQVQFITYLLDKYGEDYKAMARDKKNYYQLTWRQIRAKIKTFKGVPEQYNEYLSKKIVT